MTKYSNFSHHSHPDIFALIVQQTFSINRALLQIFNFFSTWIAIAFRRRLATNAKPRFCIDEMSPLNRVLIEGTAKASSTSYALPSHVQNPETGLSGFPPGGEISKK